jgi:hypothetical protein
MAQFYRLGIVSYSCLYSIYKQVMLWSFGIIFSAVMDRKW